eukprot:scaffold2006_cov283-Chaetoceros_neogracile.AAC.10
MTRSVKQGSNNECNSPIRIPTHTNSNSLADLYRLVGGNWQLLRKHSAPIKACSRIYTSANRNN